jgi:hypothetical protein
MLRSLFARRAFLFRRLTRYVIAESLNVLGNFAPSSVAVQLWRGTLALNPHHVAAALNRASVLFQQNKPNAWQAFQDALTAIRNPQSTSASDLALTWVPGRLGRKLAQRMLWGRLISDSMLEADDQAKQKGLIGLARQHFERCMRDGDWERAQDALDVLRSVQGDTLALHWAQAELFWASGHPTETVTIICDLVTQEKFVSPLDPIRWAERCLNTNELDLAAKCLECAQRWTPEQSSVWQLCGQLALVQGDSVRAKLFFERAHAQNPEDVSVFLKCLGIYQGVLLQNKIQVTALPSMDLGSTVEIECAIESTHRGWTIHCLPSKGWGTVAELPTQSTDEMGKCVFRISAHRPHRVYGKPWRLTFVAVREQNYSVAQIDIEVPDNQPGRLLVLCTEDHEIWEERGGLSIEQLQKLFVEKSRFASSQFYPWTHMVEAGSTLAMTEWAAQQDSTWGGLRDAAREHLIAQVKEGNDIQPHWHAFNNPHSPDFPYHLASNGWAPNDKFLLTAEECRRDFVRAYSPQERIFQVADVVAQVENLGRQGDPNYRAVLWRTGQLEFGDDANDRAWSAVALLRAGIVADTDLRDTAPAFFASAHDPFVPSVDGVLVQLPIWGNLEGNYFNDANALKRRVQNTIAPLRNNQGAIRPGVYLFTLLTHDKFVNARRGGDEFRLDAEYGDWATIRAHLDTWRNHGAKFVTAREGIAELLDDSALRLSAWLSEETRINERMLRYTLRLLGKDIPVSREYSHPVLVTIPPSFRARIEQIRVEQDGNSLPIDVSNTGYFWLSVSRRDAPIYCYFDLSGTV